MPRSSEVPVDLSELSESWWRAVALRTEWLDHALCSAPADRGASENAITALYALLDRPPPQFVWVDSPAAAVRVLPQSTVDLTSHGSWPLEGRLATLLSSLRDRLDRRTGGHRDFRSPVMTDPMAAMRAGETLRSLIDGGVHAPLRRVVRESVAGAIRTTVSERLGLTWHGQHDADWIAFYDAHRRILGANFGDADTAQLDLWVALARSCGWWWPREDVCVIAERPALVRTEPVTDSLLGEVRLHDADGPTVTFRDGWSVHSWHGTTVPSWVIDAPTVDLISEESNIEVRRCAIERIGWTAFIEQAGLALLSTAPDPGNPGAELRLFELPFSRWGRPSRLLIAVNGSTERDGTRRWYGLRVPAWFTDPIDAAGWSYGLTGVQYAQLQRRT